MKRIIFFGITTFLFLTIFSSCKKEEHVATTTEKIQQKWSVVNIKASSGTSGTVVIRSNPDQDFMEFRTDLKVLTYIDSQSDMVDYYVINDNVLSIDGETYTISNLSKTTLTLSTTQETNSVEVTMTIELMNLK